MALRQLTSPASRSCCSSRYQAASKTSSNAIKSYVRAARSHMRTDKRPSGPTAKDGQRNDKLDIAGRTADRTADRMVHVEAYSGYQNSFDNRHQLSSAFSDLSYGQASVALLAAAGLGAVTADVGVPGALVMTGLLASYLWPLQAASLMEVGRSAVKVVLGYATALLWTNRRIQPKIQPPSTSVYPALKSFELSTAFDEIDTPVKPATPATPKVTISPKAFTKPASWTAQPQHYSAAQETMTHLQAPAAVVLTPPARWRHKVTVSPPTSSLLVDSLSAPSSPLAGPHSVKTPGVSLDLALAQPVGLRPLSIATVGLHMPHTDTPRALDPSSRELKPTGRAGVMVAKPSAETYARRLAQQKDWEVAVSEGSSVAGSSGQLLPRVQVSNMAELLSAEWHEVVVFAATPMEWGVQGSKQVTWGDLKLVAAYGLAA